jgi:hypothetical protein
MASISAAGSFTPEGLPSPGWLERMIVGICDTVKPAA